MNTLAPIADILNRIERRVEESHGDVLNALFDHIDRKIALLELEAEKCSYAAALGNYTAAIIMAHHMRKHIDDMFVVRSEQIERLQERLYDYERRARAVRVGMYSNVCRVCAPCKTRSKRWPEYTHFKDGPVVIAESETSEGPMFYRNGEKMLFSGVGALLKFQGETGETVSIST